MVNIKFQHHTPFLLPTKVTLKPVELHPNIYLRPLQRSLPLISHLSNEQIMLQRNTQHLQNQHAKMCTHYLHQALGIMHLGTDCILLLYQFTWENEPQNTASQDPPSQSKVIFRGVNFVMSHLQYIICTEGGVQISNNKYIIFVTVSTNTRPLCGTYFYVNRRTKLKFKIYICYKVTH